MARMDRLEAVRTTHRVCEYSSNVQVPTRRCFQKMESICAENNGKVARTHVSYQARGERYTVDAVYLKAEFLRCDLRACCWRAPAEGGTHRKLALQAAGSL